MLISDCSVPKNSVKPRRKLVPNRYVELSPLTHPVLLQRCKVYFRYIIPLTREVSLTGNKLIHSFSSVLYVHAYFFFLNTNLSLWNFRVCTISGLFCRKFHKCILSSEQTETRAPYKTQEIKLSIIPKRLNQLAYNSYKMFPLFIVHKCLSFVS